MLLKMFDVLVVRGMETEIPVCVPRHEAELLAMIHGADGMRLRSEEPAGALEFADVQDERERLRLKYGLKAEDAYTDRYAVMLRQAKADNFGVDGEERKVVYDPYAVPVKPHQLVP